MIQLAIIEELTNKTTIKEYYGAGFDAIVYKLYGLTDDEIKIVEGNISGEKYTEEPKS